MKGLPSTCCQCGVALSCTVPGRRPLELFCDCLVALCKDCGLAQLEQLARHFKAGELYIKCPVCGSRSSSDKNGYVSDSPKAAAELMRLHKLIRERFPAVAKGAKGEQQLVQRYLEMGFSDCPGNKKALALFIARCEDHLQKHSGPPQAGDSLSLGPLNLLLKTNLVLEQALGAASGERGGDEEARFLAEVTTTCITCQAVLKQGNTVRGGNCSCASSCCQLCTRRTVAALGSYVNCCFCRDPLPVTNVKAAVTLQRELLQSLILDMTGGAKAKLKRAQIYQGCWELKAIRLVDVPADFHLDDQDAFMNLDDALLNLGLARMGAELQRRQSRQAKADYLPLGPLGRLGIRRNVFLECVLAAMKPPGGEEELDPDEVSPQDMYLPDPDAEIDEIRPTMQGCDALGGDLGEGRVLRLAEGEDSVRDLFRPPSASTPCPHPHCSVDPQCPFYLAQHQEHFHRGAGAVGQWQEQMLAHPQGQMAAIEGGVLGVRTRFGQHRGAGDGGDEGGAGDGNDEIRLTAFEVDEASEPLPPISPPLPSLQLPLPLP
ncbi:hypothetical protein B484DRAFT_230203 [Ochromonadaceae sp. CCMP2298]|nr:hypothetical protein B484DRAFT_230203 [Ochromonadaceae sp. CCMP2298]